MTHGMRRPGRNMAMQTQTLTRPKNLSASLSAASICADVLALFIGLGSAYTVKLVGDFPLSEIFVIVSVPILFALRPERIFRPDFKTAFLLLGLWLFGLIMTDLYRATEIVNWLRGDARLLFFVIDFICLAALVGRNERRKVVLLSGIAVGSLVVVRLQPSDFFEAEPWKFGYSGGVMLLVMLVSCIFFQRRQYAIVGIVIIGLIGVNIFFNFRSPVLFLLMTAALILPVIPERIGRLTILPKAGTALRVGVLAMMTMAAAGVALSAIRVASSIGFLGEEAQKKNETQSQSRGGILIGGRPEILVSSQAVLDSPILGHGSWAKDPKYTDMLYDIEAEYDLKPNLDEMVEAGGDLIPAHSHLMGAWVEAGILGALFWGYVILLVIKSIVRISILRPATAPLYTWMLLVFAWDIFFSPISTGRRLGEGLLLVVIYDLLATGHSALKKPLRAARIGFGSRGPFRPGNVAVPLPPRPATGQSQR